MTTTTIQRRKIVDINTTLINLSNMDSLPFKVAYGLHKNKSIITKEFEAIVEAEKKTVTPKYQEYENARLALCNEYCKKDEKGQPITIIQNETQAFSIQEDKIGEFEEKANELKNKYLETIQETDKLREEFNKFLDENVDIEVYKIPLTEFEKLDSISVNKLDNIFYMVQE